MNEEIIQNINERLDSAIDRSRKVLEDEQLQQRIQELRFQTEQTIRKHPVKSVLAGLAAGYLVARLFNSDD